VDQNGEVNVEQLADQVTLGGAHSILGRALLIHSGPDDYKSQPAGDAGERLACGVIEEE
jgi:Cu-Zn family superoxide dismutase